MPRPGATGALLTQLQAGGLSPAIFVSVQFASATAYMWSGIGSVTWNGQTWTGLGSLLGIGSIESAATVEARGVTITLSGLDSALLASCCTEFQLGLPVAIYFTAYSGGSLIATPIVAWSGRTDRPEFYVAGDKATISLACENRLLDMNIPVERRHTNEDQQMDYPGDLGLQFVNGIQNLSIFVAGQANTTSYL